MELRTAAIPPSRWIILFLLLADDWRNFDPVGALTPTAAGAVLTGVLPLRPQAGLVHEHPSADGEQPATSAVLLMQVNFF